MEAAEAAAKAERAKEKERRAKMEREAEEALGIEEVTSDTDREDSSTEDSPADRGGDTQWELNSDAAMESDQDIDDSEDEYDDVENEVLLDDDDEEE